jgi:hypothetical protein
MLMVRLVLTMSLFLPLLFSIKPIIRAKNSILFCLVEIFDQLSGFLSQYSRILGDSGDEIESV